MIKCTQCKSDKIIKGLHPIDRGHYNQSDTLAIELVTKPEAILFKGTKQIPLYAHICRDCGNVMFQLSKEELDIVNESI